jgi:hypothetical protein
MIDVDLTRKILQLYMEDDNFELRLWYSHEAIPLSNHDRG